MTDNAEIYDRLRQVEKDTALNGQKMDQLEANVRRVETEKIDPMASQVADLHGTMTRNKGFWAGVFLTAGAVWTVLAGAFAAFWKVIAGE